jgi:hypothetical protein
MALEVFTGVEQGTEAWHRLRAGMPTASMFHTIVGIKKDARDKVTRQTYMKKLAGEIVTGQPMDSYSNDHMERGKAMEDEARDLYSFMHDADPQRIGFVVNGPKGCSPDSFLGDNGVLEIKTKLAHLAIDCILKNEFPSEHKAQCQGALWVCEREWVDICVYWPGLPLFVKRSHRDEDFIKQLADEVDRFNVELAEMVERVKRYGTPMRQAA